MAQLIFRKGLDLKDAVAGELAAAYDSQVVDAVRANDFTHTSGRLTIHLAREFGFCYGVDRAVDYAYQTRKRFPERRVFLTGEIIHNPHVNDRLRGQEGDDRLHGARGNDLLTGFVGDDILWGGLDDDTLVGGDGEDRLLGGDGDDLLRGGRGHDRLEGGVGNDLYALGVLAYEMLVGRPPFPREQAIQVLYAQVHEPPPSPRSLRPELPEAVEAALQRQLGKDPSQRFGSAGAFLSALRGQPTPAGASGSATLAPPPPLRRPPERRPGMRTRRGRGRGPRRRARGGAVRSFAECSAVSEHPDGVGARPERETYSVVSMGIGS